MTTSFEVFGSLFKFLPKSGFKASSGKELGQYPFFTSSNIQKKWIDIATYKTEGLIFGTGGNASVHYVKGGFSTSTDCLVAEPIETGLICSRYCFHYLNAHIGLLEAGFRGAGLKHIAKGYIQSINVPLPPISEQRRIAAILDQADALRANRREALAQLDNLRQSIFIEIFGDPVVNPKGWENVCLKSLLSMPLRNGLSPSNSGSVAAKVLTLSAITGDEFDTAAWKESTFQSIPPSHQSVNSSDFLICRGNGNLRLVGKGYFPTCSMVDVTFPDTMIAARIFSERIEREFLQHLWHSDAIRYQIEATARTTNGTFKVNQTMLEEVSFILPPLQLQQTFANRIKLIEGLKVTHRASLSELDTLFASLQHRAFHGEL